jgi:hypothetical protein
MASLEDLTVDQLREAAAQFQASHNVLTALTRDPATREVMQRAIKKMNPEVSIPELDARDQVRTELENTNKKLTTLENQIQERDIRDRITRQREAVKTKYQLDEAQLLEVEKLMVDNDNPIPTYDAAARVFLASRTSATPTPASYVPPTYQMPEKDTWGGGIGNPAKLNRIALEESYKAWGDIRGGKVPGLEPSRAA